MGGKNSAPEPTDPKETSAAQTGTNVGTAIANSILQNPNQITPDGTLTYYVGGVPGVNGTTGTTAGTAGSTPAAYIPEITYTGPSQSSDGIGIPFSGIPQKEGKDGNAQQPTPGAYRVGDASFDSQEAAQRYRDQLVNSANAGGGDYYTYSDPYTGETYQIPRVTAVQTLSEAQQAIKDQSDAAELNLATLANDQSGFLNDYMAKPFSYNPGEYEGWALNLYESLNGEKQAQQQESLRGQLANQGIKLGSEAYDRAMESLGTSQGNSRNQFLLDAYNTGMQTALSERNQPINEITALLSGSQVSQPQFVSGGGATIPTTDNASIIANADAQEMNAYTTQQQMMGGLFGGLGKLGAAAITASDERLKEDKKKIGETEDGLGLYSFKYKGDDRTQIGLMAQDVAKKKPSAVKKMANGFLGVDYKKATS